MAPSVDLSVLDARHDAVPPDAPVVHVVTHARQLAHTVRTLAEPLSRAKVSAEHAARLDALATAVESAEAAWQSAWLKAAPGAVAKTRTALTDGRMDLFEALRVFAGDDDATQSALDAIARIEDDDDLDADVARLLPLARKHAAALDGTDITPSLVTDIETALSSFRAARAGERAVTEGVTTSQALAESARQAQALRNRAYGALAALVREVSERGRFAFRRDPPRRALFASYLSTARGSKAAAPPVPSPSPSPEPQR